MHECVRIALNPLLTPLVIINFSILKNNINNILNLIINYLIFLIKMIYIKILLTKWLIMSSKKLSRVSNNYKYNKVFIYKNSNIEFGYLFSPLVYYLYPFL